MADLGYAIMATLHVVPEEIGIRMAPKVFEGGFVMENTEPYKTLAEAEAALMLDEDLAPLDMTERVVAIRDITGL